MSSSWEGLQREEIGQTRAWYDRPDRTLVLRKCSLEDRYKMVTHSACAGWIQPAQAGFAARERP